MPAPAALARGVTGGTGRVGVRVPAHEIARAICRGAGGPLTATSANRSGQPATADPDEVERALGDDLDLADRRRPDPRRRALDDRGRHRCRADAGTGGRGSVGRDSGMAQRVADHRSATAQRATPVRRAASGPRWSGLIAGRARRLDAERSLDELAGLAEAAGAEVVLRVMQERPKPDPSTFLGAGKIATLAASAAETDVDVVVFDNELTPAQLRQIEEQVGRKIIDRTQLILDIFARRARTREGQAAGRAGAAQIPAAAARRVPAPRSRGSAAASEREALARRSSKPIAAASARVFTPSPRTSSRCGSAARSCASGARRRRCRRSRSSATRTRGRRRCSTC